MVLRIAIVDDEEFFRKRIGTILEKFLDIRKTEYRIDFYCSGADIVRLGKNICDYNVFFLDVSMKDVDGIAAAREIREYSRNAVIVFVTAYIDYSIEGYKVNALRYVLKDGNNLEDSLHECMEAVLMEVSKKNPSICFHFNEGEKLIHTDKIMYIESRLHKLEFHMADDGESIYTMYNTLNEMEQKLETFRTFIRIHQSFLANLKYIEMVNNYTISLSNGEEIKASRSRYSSVKREFIKYIGEV